MQLSDGNLWLGAIVLLMSSAGAATFITRWFERRKTAAETELTHAQATDVLVKAGKTAVEIMDEQLTRALHRIDILEAERANDKITIDDLQAEVASLRRRVAELESGA